LHIRRFLVHCTRGSPRVNRIGGYFMAYRVKVFSNLKNVSWISPGNWLGWICIVVIIDRQYSVTTEVSTWWAWVPLMKMSCWGGACSQSDSAGGNTEVGTAVSRCCCLCRWPVLGDCTRPAGTRCEFYRWRCVHVPRRGRGRRTLRWTTNSRRCPRQVVCICVSRQGPPDILVASALIWSVTQSSKPNQRTNDATAAPLKLRPYGTIKSVYYYYYYHLLAIKFYIYRVVQNKLDYSTFQQGLQKFA